MLYRPNVPSDPMFKLSIPQPDMLSQPHLDLLLTTMNNPDTSRVKMRVISESIRQRLNPHPAGQKEENVPWLDGSPVQGLQHKYRETALFFPSEVSSG
jgi:L-lysine 2,3-aminomutase